MTPPTAEHNAFMADAKALLGKYEHLDAVQLLALASQLVGNIVALQDQTKMTVDTVMAVVASNIEEGNAVAIDTFLGQTAGAA